MVDYQVEKDSAACAGAGESMKLYRGDYAVAGAVLLLALLLAAWVYLPALGGGERGTAKIYQYGQLKATVPLGTQGELRLEGAVVRYGDGGIWFQSADCPDQVCVHTGVLRRAGQSAICAPNQIVIEIEGSGPDAVVS